MRSSEDATETTRSTEGKGAAARSGKTTRHRPGPPAAPRRAARESAEKAAAHAASTWAPTGGACALELPLPLSLSLPLLLRPPPPPPPPPPPLPPPPATRMFCAPSARARGGGTIPRCAVHGERAPGEQTKIALAQVGPSAPPDRCTLVPRPRARMAARRRDTGSSLPRCPAPPPPPPPPPPLPPPLPPPPPPAGNLAVSVAEPAPVQSAPERPRKARLSLPRQSVQWHEPACSPAGVAQTARPLPAPPPRKTRSPKLTRRARDSAPQCAQRVRVVCPPPPPPPPPPLPLPPSPPPPPACWRRARFTAATALTPSSSVHSCRTKPAVGAVHTMSARKPSSRAIQRSASAEA